MTDLQLPRTPAEESEITPLPYAEIMRTLPAPWPDSEIEARTRRRILASGQKLVVIDDDPTGCQTVHDVPLLLEWSADALCEGLRDPAPALFVLTNSRAMSTSQAERVNVEIARNLSQAWQRCAAPYVILSRSDSTLRGHFPAETDALNRELGPYDGLLLAPCFFEGGRYTLNGIHWVRQGRRLLPAAQTESAADPSFGFHHSYLPAWIEEKTGGRLQADQVCVISIEDIRAGGPDRITARLSELPPGGIATIDAADYEDLSVFMTGLLNVEAAGRRFLYRTAASFARVRAGVAPAPLLSRDQLLPQQRGRARGLVIVGSFVPRSTAQLERVLRAHPELGIELHTPDLLTEQRERAIEHVARQICATFERGGTPVAYTSRELSLGRDAVESLEIMRQISEAIVAVARRAATKCAFDFIISKGGITSHDVALKALGARRARVLGPVAAGVPVWRLGPEAILPGKPYVVFPGNVGDEDNLLHVMEVLIGSRRRLSDAAG